MIFYNTTRRIMINDGDGAGTTIAKRIEPSNGMFYIELEANSVRWTRRIASFLTEKEADNQMDWIARAYTEKCPVVCLFDGDGDEGDKNGK